MDDMSLNQPKELTPHELLVQKTRKLGMAAAQAQRLTQTWLRTKGMRRPISPEEERAYFRRNPDRMHRVAARSQDVLATARTVILPSNVFPDTVTVDRTKVTITQRTFFWSADVVSLRIEDILNVSTSFGPFFGSLTISTRVMNSTDHFIITGFWKWDAIRLKRIIQGYMIAVHNGIDSFELSTPRLIRKLNELGSEPSGKD